MIDPTANMDGVADDPITGGGEGANGGGDVNGGGDGDGDGNGGDGDNDPDEGKNNASMLPFDVIMLSLAVLLHVATEFTIL